jgi:hypothetical protein
MEEVAEHFPGWQDKANSQGISLLEVVNEHLQG